MYTNYVSDVNTANDQYDIIKTVIIPIEMQYNTNAFKDDGGGDTKAQCATIVPTRSNLLAVQ